MIRHDTIRYGRDVEVESKVGKMLNECWFERTLIIAVGNKVDYDSIYIDD